MSDTPEPPICFACLLAFVATDSTGMGWCTRCGTKQFVHPEPVPPAGVAIRRFDPPAAMVEMAVAYDQIFAEKQDAS